MLRSEVFARFPNKLLVIQLDEERHAILVSYLRAAAEFRTIDLSVSRSTYQSLELHLYTLHHYVKVAASDCNAAMRPRLIIFERFSDDCQNIFLLWFYVLWGSWITNQTRCYLFKRTREKQQKLRLGSHTYFHEWAR